MVLDDEISLVIILAGAFVMLFLIAYVLSVRKRMEVLDLTAEEFQLISKLQEAKGPSDGARLPKPVGLPTFSDRDHGPIKVFRNGIQARFICVEDLNLVRTSTGFQKRYVAKYRTMFYLFEMIAGIYPISINIVRKKGGGRKGFHSENLESFGTIINMAMAYADDGLDPSMRKNKFTTLQVETTDYQTAILCPGISRGYCNLTAIMQALGLAMGPQAKQKVRTKMWLHGFYLIFEEPGHYDSESPSYRRGDRTRVMLGDIHKHYALRSQSGYPLRRRLALDTLRMQDISTLDERLRT
ncbi:MAG: hypothetical protein LN414_06335 [Candidatus Thermoplasmatota archaeon]|nr:hypothetical protein [Candidatus Thermoplasmatota archaeon]